MVGKKESWIWNLVERVSWKDWVCLYIIWDWYYILIVVINNKKFKEIIMYWVFKVERRILEEKMLRNWEFRILKGLFYEFEFFNKYERSSNGMSDNGLRIYYIWRIKLGWVGVGVVDYIIKWDDKVFDLIIWI